MIDKDIAMIVAVSNNGAIGKDNTIPWRLPNDLQWFKAHTLETTLIMGRKTFESLPKILPHRNHIVVSTTMEPVEGVVVAKNFEEAIQKAHLLGRPIFIAGGQRMYEQGMEHASRLYITYVDTTVENADAFFPPVDLDVWKEASKIPMQPDERHLIPYVFKSFVRK